MHIDCSEDVSHEKPCTHEKIVRYNERRGNVIVLGFGKKNEVLPIKHLETFNCSTAMSE